MPIHLLTQKATLEQVREMLLEHETMIKDEALCAQVEAITRQVLEGVA